jgi:polar amino acid transport system substrate-binding protein
MNVKSLLVSGVIFSGLFSAISTVTADPFKMAYNSDWPPFSSGAGKDVGGILPDLLQHLIATKLGMDTSHAGYPWKRAQHTVKSGKLDALLTVPTNARLAWSQSSKSVVYEVEMRAVVKRGSKADNALSANPYPAALAGFKVCDILGNGWGSRFMKTNKIPFETATNVSRCMDMIAKGRMDVTIQSVAVASQNIREGALDENLRILPNTYGAMAFTLLVSKKMKGADAFLKKFDALVSEMKSDGSLTKLISDLRSK